MRRQDFPPNQYRLARGYRNSSPDNLRYGREHSERAPSFEGGRQRGSERYEAARRWQPPPEFGPGGREYYGYGAEPRRENQSRDYAAFGEPYHEAGRGGDYASDWRGYGREDQERGGEYAGAFQGDFGREYRGSEYGRNMGGYRPGGFSEYGPYRENYQGTGDDWRRSEGSRGYRAGYGGDYSGAYGAGAEYNPREQEHAAGQRRGGPKGYTRSDERIKDDVCERLYGREDLEVSDVSVEVKSGKVTLEGTVPERHMKHRIEDVVDDCIGVQDIQNHIRVQRAGEESEPARQSAGSSRKH